MPSFRTCAAGAGGLVLLAALFYWLEAEPGPCVAVSGTVLVRGQPAAGAHVAFYPVSDGAPQNVPTAVVGADGTFRLTTFKRHDGAPVGAYAVTVFWPDPSKASSYPEKCPDLLNGRYRSAETTPLKVTIHRATELEPFVLQ